MLLTKKLSVALAGAVNENVTGEPAEGLNPASLSQFVQRLVKLTGPLNTVTKPKLVVGFV
jgi:hypothetical protein